jgi:hypothetical protein
MQTATETEFTIDACLKPIHEVLLAAGYKHRVTQKEYTEHQKTYYHCSYSHAERGIRFAISTTRYLNPIHHDHDHISITTYQRNERGSMKKAYPRDVPGALYPSKPNWRTELAEFIKIIPTLQGETVTNPRLKSKSQLAKPYRFNKPSLTIDAGIVVKTHLFDTCWVLKPVTIADNLKISADVAKPGTDTWFHIKGNMSGLSSGQPEMIVTHENDELIYYPVMYGKATTELIQEGSYIDFNKVTQEDAQTIIMAIDHYLNKTK